MAGRLTATLARFDQTELRLCRYLNRTNNRKLVRALFRAVSWLGDGWLWYALLAVLPLIHGADGLAATLHMTVTGTVGVIFYKIIKQHAVRERPYVTHRAHIECACAPLDKYSFPSGHTLHAVSFTLLIAHYFPDWGPHPLPALPHSLRCRASYSGCTTRPTSRRGQSWADCSRPRACRCRPLQASDGARHRA